MVEAAGIEPPLESDTSTTLPEQKPHTNHTPEGACEELFDTLLAHSGQNRDTFLRVVCEIYVKWAELPSVVRNAVNEWYSLTRELRQSVELILAGAADLEEG
jgi:hypothetical protein